MFTRETVAHRQYLRQTKFMNMSRPLYEVDPQVAIAIDNEVRRQHEGLELIASENFVSEAVLEAMGSVFTNKYAEGYPGKRYYGGCEYADVVEELARERAKELFGAEHANVQPHAGSQANMEAYAAVLQPGDTILGLNLAHGGHLTHGHHLNFSGKTYRIVPYGVTKDTETMQPEFRDYARQVVANAKVLAGTLAAEGFRIISGGTDTHLMLVDVFSKGMFGSEAEKALGEAAITVNKNAIPFDANPPMKPSGIRIGSPALTTRGMKEPEMRQVGRWIAEALNNRTDAAALAKVRKQVVELAEVFPLYPERRAKAQVEARA